MSLVKKPRMTEKKLAAIRRNQKLSHGPATPEGRERIRTARLRHGFYSKSEEAALRTLGEDPADLRQLRERLCDRSTAIPGLQDRLGDRLARAFIRMERADRMQEGYALRLAKEEDFLREGRLHVQMMRLKLTARNWQRLARSVARPKYLTTDADLKMMLHLHKEGVVKEMSEVALALFYQLRKPGRPMPGDPEFESEEEQAQSRRALARIRSIFGLSEPEDAEVINLHTLKDNVGDFPQPEQPPSPVPMPWGNGAEDDRAPSFETVLRVMYEAGYTGDVYPSPGMWHAAPTGVYARYPFANSLDDRRSGGG